MAPTALLSPPPPEERLTGAEKRSAAVVAESLLHQLASAQAAWQDAEKERPEVSPLT